MKRITTLLLLVALLVPSLIACSSNDSGNSVDTTAADAGAGTAAETTHEPTDGELFESAKKAMPKIDYKGYEFRFLDRQDANGNWTTHDVYAEKETGDVINDAVFKRNMALEENFNIKITERKIEPYSKVSSTAATEILSGDETFDVLTDGLNMITTSLATPGYLIDFNEVPEIDLTKPYWDQMMTESMTIKGKTYFATGDISTMDNQGTWAVLFNKKFIDDFKLEDPYEHVDKGTWTLDMFYDMAKAVTRDVNGDGVLDINDQWGYLGENANSFLFWLATGERLTKMNDEGVPELCMYNDRAVSVVEKVQKIQLDDTMCISNAVTGNTMAVLNNKFFDGDALFIYGGMMLISFFRSSDVDFGIAPAPKFDEAQDQYYSSYSYSNTTAYVIPITASDTSRTGNVLEQMANLSQYTLTPAYIDVSLEGKFLRDEKSAEMIDLILRTRNFDIGAIYDWGTIRSMFYNVLFKNKSTDFASAYAAIETSAKAAIDAYVSKLPD